MFEILEFNGQRRRLVDTAEGFAAAEAKARELFAVLFLEVDADHPDCADCGAFL